MLALQFSEFGLVSNLRLIDVAIASLIEIWIDKIERRTWFLSEIVAEH
jgi:hypothetical protein